MLQTAKDSLTLPLCWRRSTAERRRRRSRPPSTASSTNIYSPVAGDNNGNIVNGDVNGRLVTHAPGSSKVRLLEEKVKHIEELLAEKEQLDKAIQEGRAGFKHNNREDMPLTDYIARQVELYRDQGKRKAVNLIPRL